MESFEATARSYRRARLPYCAELLRWLSDRVPALEKSLVLDLGCGPGTLSVPLAGACRRVLAIDESESMLGELLEEARGIQGRVHALQARGEELPVRESSVDLICCAQSLHWMDEGAVLAEADRVLRRTGALLICWQEWMEPASPQEQVYASAFHAAQVRRPARDPARPAMRDAGRNLGASAHEFRRDVTCRFTPRELARFFLSREETGRLGDEERRRLESHWASEAARELGEQVPYRFRVRGRLFPRSSLTRVGAGGP